tara:strand:+ start:185 stop:436 length:252 start_codon:yes stop_codon:yes gene_type:complete
VCPESLKPAISVYIETNSLIGVTFVNVGRKMLDGMEWTRWGFIRYEIVILELESTKYPDNELFPQMIDFYKKELKKLEDKIND